MLHHDIRLFITYAYIHYGFIVRSVKYVVSSPRLYVKN